MSFVVEYRKGKLVKYERFYEKSTPSPLVLCDDGKTAVVGEVFGITYNEISSLPWRENPDIINEIQGNVSIVFADDNECVLACDETGVDILYYYHKEDIFIVSDDLWDIARCIQITFTDINQSWVRKAIISQLASNETVINELKILMPMQIVKYNPKYNTLLLREYKKFHYRKEINTIDEAVESMDECVDKFFGLMKKKFGEKCLYGMGLSGGLDSRVIPHYAKKHDLKLTSYNICVSKPNGLLMANSCRNARKLAQSYGIPFKLVEYNEKSIAEKLELKTRMHPIGTSRNIFKYENRNVPEYDVLLSGGYGVLIGDYLPLDIEAQDKNGVIHAIENLFLGMNNSTITFKSRVIKAINYMFGCSIKDSSKYDIEVVNDLLKTDYAEAREYIRNFVEEMYSSGEYDNIEIFYKFFLLMLSSRDRYGAFESQFGTRRSITLYMPFLHKETKKWNSSLLLDRQVLKELINRKIPEARDIGTDTYTAAPNRQNAFFDRVTSIINRVIRGNGTAIDEHYFKSKAVQSEIKKCMENSDEWFYRIIDIKMDYKKIMTRSHLRMAVCIWELKYLIDYIEEGKYMN